MSMQLILFLNGEQLDVYRADRSQVAHLARFDTDAGGREAFAGFLDDQPDVPCRILVDLIEEEFRQEVLPHVTGSDRKILQARHAARLFRTTPYRFSRVSGRETGGRRDDRVMFSALTNHELVEPWVALLAAHKKPLYGIHSVPILSCRIANAAGAGNGNILLLTLQQGDRLRQTFLQNKIVCFSRLTPLPETDIDGFGKLINAEIEKTRRYITSLKLLGFEDTLQATLVLDSERLKSAQAHCAGSDHLHLHFHDVQTVAAKLGIPRYPDHSYCDLLFTVLASRAQGQNHYAQPAHLVQARVHRGKDLINKTSLLLATIALAWAGINMIDATALKSKQAGLEAATVAAQQALDEINKRKQLVQVEPKDVLAAVEIANAIQARAIQPRTLLASLGGVLQQNPALAMDRLEWNPRSGQIADDAETDPGTESGTAVNQIQVTIEGHVLDFDGSYLHANQQINRLTGMLANLPEVVSASIVKQPANTAPNASLTGSVNKLQDADKAAFIVQLTMENRHGKS